MVVDFHWEAPGKIRLFIYRDTEKGTYNNGPYLQLAITISFIFRVLSSSDVLPHITFIIARHFLIHLSTVTAHAKAAFVDTPSFFQVSQVYYAHTCVCSFVLEIRAHFTRRRETSVQSGVVKLDRLGLSGIWVCIWILVELLVGINGILFHRCMREPSLMEPSDDLDM